MQQNNSGVDSNSNLRLLIGFSRKGPVNSVQLISTPAQFVKTYGNIDRYLEKRGSYFHRSALVALSVGPILCLNLLSLDPDRDQIMHRSFSTNVKKLNNNIKTIPYQNVYNTDKFWSLSSESYLDGVKLFENKMGILNFSNIGDKPISVLVKKANKKNTEGYNITLNEWYGEENVPEYFNGNSYVSDYMVEVYVIGGDFGPSLTKEISKLSNNADAENFVRTYDYKNDCLSVYDDASKNPYKRFASDITYQEYFDKYGFKSDKLDKFLNLYSVNVIATYVGSLIPQFVNKINQNMWIEDIINSDTLSTGLLCSVNVDLIENASVDEESGIVNEEIDIIGHNYHVLKNNSKIDFLSYGISLERMEELDNINSDNDNLTYICDINIHEKGSSGTYFIDEKGTPLNVYADNEIIISMTDFKNEETKVKYIKVGDMLVSHYVDYETEEEKIFSRLTRVVEIKPLYRETSIDGKYSKDDNHVRIICSDNIRRFNDSTNGVEDITKQYVMKYSTIDEICDRYHWTLLGGFKCSEDSMPNGTNERQNEILNLIDINNNDYNLYKSLIDRDNIQWRYLVDTFGYGVENECKKVYSRLCKGRQSGLAIVNMPSIKDFKKSVEPSFVDNFGNLDYAPSYLFSLPKEENGASWAAYYYPYLKISDNNVIKNVPPAAYVSNLYINKYTNYNPWSIVAGPKRGVISGNQVIGLEGTLLKNDREYLEPMGVNSIIWENGVGVEVFANKTAKQSPVSALSSIHAREMCIHIQDKVESILKKYNWEANTARNREEIKLLVDTFLTSLKENEGLYDFKTVMDTTNNTTEIIDKNMGVIDIYVEIVRGLEILAQRLTVLKTGSIESGNFE